MVLPKPALLLLLLAQLVFLSACATLNTEEAQREATLADLQPAVNFYRPQSASPSADAVSGESSVGEEVFIPSPEQALENYRALLKVTDDPDMQAMVKYRMAGLEMMISERQQAEGQVGSDGELPDNYYELAIGNYVTLLKQYPDKESNDQLLYQLAKAYELSAKTELSLQTLDTLVKRFPRSEHVPEAHFRRGEIYFSRKDYQAAGSSYKRVIDFGSDSAFFQNAYYMHGWSLFKRNQYPAALNSFTKVLDQNMDGSVELSGLAGSQSSLVNDTIRIMSLVFSYLKGGDSIASLYAQEGPRPYEHILYDQLAQLLITQERYGDTARSYRKYIERYPNSRWAPQFHVKMIIAYRDGGFNSKLLPEKERYVKTYGIYSQYWAVADLDTKWQLKPHLREYLLELSQYYHSKAQVSKKRLAKKRRPTQRDQHSVWQRYKIASLWYREFIATFPQDIKTAELRFLMAESLFESHDYPLAISAYEKVAYEYEEHPQGADAGYAAILAYQRQYESISDRDDVLEALKVEWRRQKVDSQLRYASRYFSDPRAVEVLTNAAEELFRIGDYESALFAAYRVTDWQPIAGVSLQVTAWLVIGHSNFDLQQYQQAESAYRHSLALMDAKHLERKATTEKMAASVYRQGEQSLAAGDKAAAVEHFLRVGTLAPNSPIRINAEYDAATHLIAMEQWPKAIRVMDDFRQRYPDHRFASDMPARMAFAYQATGQWALAAAELLAISSASEDVEAKRQAHYLYAELFDKAGDTKKAIDSYRSYAHTYPQPFDEAIEARYKMSEFYVQTREQEKQRYWLKKIINADANAGQQRTERSRYLAAKASSVFAEDARWAFNSIKLSLPLKRSLRKKKKALKVAIKRYQQTADYGVEEFATKAIYYLGEIYAQLSRDLIDSDRPKGLNELELEQYEILLEEQAYPFEDKSIAIHEANSQRSWQGTYDKWVKQSFESLSVLSPGRYKKSEKKVVFSDSIY